jgi:tripartite-type tricarboxylate transporter receptor subunit TctC
MSRLLMGGLIAWLAATNAFSQAYPSKPVRIVVPLSPGGFADTPARMLAPRLSEQMGRQFFVENKPGAGGSIGADFVAQSAPDGYTLLLTGTPHVISAHLYKKLPYDALKDFTPIALVASGPYALGVTTPKRWSELPEIPTLAEAGVPGYEATLWLNFSGPAGMPADIVQRLNGEIAKALGDAELQANFRAAGVEATSMGPQELSAFMRAEYEKWGRVVRETGATVN